MLNEQKNISIDELKKIELDILRQIHEVCTQNGFRYSLAGGTLLGAVRHGGFIPWDDDIDIFMPRPDYEKLIEYCKTHQTPFKLICNETESKYSYLFAKAVNPNTVIIEEGSNRTKVDLGVYVDIFPIDGLGGDYESATKKFNKSKFLRELLVAYNWKKYFRSKTRSIIYEPIRLMMFLISRFVRHSKIINKIQRIYRPEDFENSNYSACICGAYRLKEINSKEVYSNFTDIEFEGEKFKAITNYDAYMKSIYGDYMKLPPKEKQKSHHTFVAYWK